MGAPTSKGLGDTGYLLAAARQFRETAVNHVPRGAGELGAEGHAWPEAIDQFAQALHERAQICAKNFPVEGAYTNAMAAIAAMLSDAAQAARALGPSFDAAHQPELARLTSPRPGEGRRDTSSNR